MTCPTCQSQAGIETVKQGMRFFVCPSCSFEVSDTQCSSRSCGKYATGKCKECSQPRCRSHGGRGSGRCTACRNRARRGRKSGNPEVRKWST